MSDRNNKRVSKAGQHNNLYIKMRFYQNYFRTSQLDYTAFVLELWTSLMKYKVT